MGTLGAVIFTDAPDRLRSEAADLGSVTLAGLGSPGVSHMPRPVDPRASGRARRYLAPASALAGTGLLVWLIASVGPMRLIELWMAVRSILPLIVGLAGLRYVLQAAGWRLATRATERPGWGPTLAGVVAGEAAGYVAGGMMAREPVKLLFVRDRVPMRAAFSGAAVERLASMSAGAALILTAGIVVASRQSPVVLAWVAAATLALSIALALRHRARPRADKPGTDAAGGRLRKALASTRKVGTDLWRNRRPALAGIGALGLAQEAVNVAEAYILLTWLGAAPAILTVIVFEAANRVVNTLGQFVPGRMGVSEASSALVAGTLSLTPAFGLSLALARRARSLIWAIAGLSLLVLRTVVTSAAGSGGGEQRRTTIAVA